MILYWGQKSVKFNPDIVTDFRKHFSPTIEWVFVLNKT